MSRLLLAIPTFAVAAVLVASAVPPDDPKPEKGRKKAPREESPEEWLAQTQLPKGLTAAVWASEPKVTNPVAFAFDENGRCFVVETFRHTDGVPDTRGHMKWLDEDLACRTVADRVAMYKRHKYPQFEQNAERLRLVWDADGDGKADKDTVFSGGYNRYEDGIAAGVLARKGDVYFACIPDLYRLRDTNGDGVADEKESLATGFGLHVQFIGHDLHGLRMGPDGKLYFSIGDRGLNVTTKEGQQLLYPNTGAVLRCDPDGANLEVIHWGLRNPQELAFDDHGNLFTYDNNSDSGDKARWVYVVDGGDSGWRGGYQYGTLYHPPGVPQGNRGPWNTEKVWHVPGPDGGPPAYVVPPLAHIGNGPSGITHYPGVGLNDKYKDHFFCADFTADPGRSVIWAVSATPKGASFEVKAESFIGGMVPTDVEFGPDGAFYWLDWSRGWSRPGKGRIFRVTDPEAMKNPAVAEAKKLISEGFEKRTVDELVRLLGHPHQQVRLEAQYALAAHGWATAGVNPAVAAVVRVALKGEDRLARLHAIWAADMIRRKNKGVAFGLSDLVRDPDAEVRAQFAKVLGGWGLNTGTLVTLMTDPDPRVKFHATISYGKALAGMSVADKYLPVFTLLQRNADADPYLRHAAVYALTRLTDKPDELVRALAAFKPASDAAAVKLGVVLALRRLKAPQLGAEFVGDADPKIAAEVARAVYDERIGEAMPKLAALVGITIDLPDPIAYRALAANYHFGDAVAAARVAEFAARENEPAHRRVFALKLLADWADPPRRDPVTGLTLDLPKRPANVAADALRPVVAGVFVGSDAVRAEAAQLSAKLGLKEVGPLMAGLVKDAKAPASTRVEALLALAALKDPAVGEVTRFALSSAEPKLRAAGLAVKAKSDPDAVVKDLPGLLKDPKASIPEKQAAFAILGGVKESPEADRLLDEWITNLPRGTVPAELALDILEATEQRVATPRLKLHAPLKQRLDDHRQRVNGRADALGPWVELGLEHGGDADRGKALFLNNSAVYCQRCHKLDGQGGDVGPPLNGIAAQPGKDRRYLLESVVLPSAKIAQGYETVVLVLVDGRTVSGVLRSEDKKQIKLVTPENKELMIPADEVESRRTGQSAMPADLHEKLTRRELRDLVEFLASLKEPEKKGGR